MRCSSARVDRRSSVRRCSVVAILFALLGGCGGDSESTAEPALSVGADDAIMVSPLDAPSTESIDIRWNPDVIRATEADVAQITTEVRGDGLAMRWPAESAARLGLASGKLLFAPGIGLFRVGAVHDADRAVEIVGTPAALGDAATYADLSFDRTVDFAAEGGSVAPMNLRIDAGHVPARSFTPPSRSTTIAPAGVRVKLGGAELEADVQRAGDRLTLEGSLATTKNDASASLRVQITFHRFRLSGDAHVRDSVTNDFHLALGHLDVAGTVEVNVQNKIEIDADSFQKVPLEIKVPVVVGGIPFFVKIGAGVLFAVSQEASSQLTIRGSFGVTGATELAQDGADEATVRRHLSTRLEMPDHDVGRAVFSAGVQFPRIGIGIGSELASAEVFAVHTWGLGRGFAYAKRRDEPITAENSCLKLDVATSQDIVGQVSLFRLSLSKKKTLWSEDNVIVQRGAKCDVFDR